MKSSDEFPTEKMVLELIWSPWLIMQGGLIVRRLADITKIALPVNITLGVSAFALEQVCCSNS